VKERAMETRTRYFEQRGKGCTTETLRAARERAAQLGVRSVVVASTHGGTALEAADVFEGTGIGVIAVSLSAAFDSEGWTMTPSERASLEARGIRVLTSLHSLADGIAEGFLGENTPGNIVANTLRWFSQGMKVAVETAIMAVEAGLVSAGSEIVAVAGTNDGADTAIVIRPSFARTVKDLRVCEILCKPRIA
jgi:hypothetical protein